MSRLPTNDVAADRAHDVALADELAWADGPAGPADGCTATPWCGCVDCWRWAVDDDELEDLP